MFACVKYFRGVIRSILWFGLGFFGPVFGIVPEERTKNISVVSSTESFHQNRFSIERAHATPKRILTREAQNSHSSCEDFLTLYQQGIASWYGPGFHGKQMANGKTYDMNALTVAHRYLPLGTHVCIKNPENGKTVLATVTDRGPYIDGRVIDLSRGVASVLGITERGIAFVTILLS